MKKFKELLSELSNTNSSIEKIAILKKYPSCQKLLKYVYDTSKQFGISSDNCKSKLNLRENTTPYKNIFELLDDLSSRKKTGNSAIAALNGFVNANSEYAEIIYKIIDKNLKLGIDEKSIIKAFPGLLDTFDVALANKFDKKTSKNVVFDGSWFASIKLDGIRLITIVKSKDDIKFYSRAGKEINTLGNLKIVFQKCIDNNPEIIGKMFDGELCIIDSEGKENFQKIVSLIHRKDFTIESPCYKIFDFMTIEEFYSGESDKIFSIRQRDLFFILNKYTNSTIQILPQWKLNSEKEFQYYVNLASENGWEGLILRKNSPYKAGRSNDLLKVKKMNDSEYKVIDVEFDTKLMKNSETGLMKEEKILSSVIIEHKGFKVNVGSGFSDEQRLYYFKHPEEIIGKTITVAYFEETKNKNKGISLRFPVIKYIYENSRDS